MVKPLRKSSSKNPPIFSHEFIIQNHADIVSCVAMVFVVGLMIQATSPLASIFIVLQHNITDTTVETALYLPGLKDWTCIFFYTLITIVVHAIIQEYVLDKISKKLHLSKSKLSTFSISGQLSIFYLVSAGWGLDLALKEHFLTDISLLWSDYPSPMSFALKLYILIQISYDLHEIPELYFQRTKREEYTSKIVQSIVAAILIYIPYFLNLNRLAVLLLVLHHISEWFNHVGQLVQTVDKEEKFTKVMGLVSNILQILARLGSIVLATLTLWYGLALGEQRELNFQDGYFNTPTIRMAVLAGVLLLQMYLTFKVISQEIARNRENKAISAISKSKIQKKEKSKKSKKSEESDLPEVDQNTNKTLRKQKVK